MRSGNAATARLASVFETVPIDAVGHATSAFSASRRSPSPSGCRWTNENPSPGAKTAGAIWRHVAQSMQVLST